MKFLVAFFALALISVALAAPQLGGLLGNSAFSNAEAVSFGGGLNGLGGFGLSSSHANAGATSGGHGGSSAQASAGASSGFTGK